LEATFVRKRLLVVDAQGTEYLSEVASTVHDTFHALMLTELDRLRKNHAELFENIICGRHYRFTARNALG